MLLRLRFRFSDCEAGLRLFQVGTGSRSIGLVASRRIKSSQDRRN